MKPNRCSSPLVSICISSFNYEHYVGRAVESALSQVYPHVEVIVVDDGSTDSSRDILARFEDRAVVIGKENGGQASAMNVAFDASSGSIVLFLDSDDVMHPEAATRLVERWEPGVAKVQFRLALIDETGARIGSFPHHDVQLPDGDVVPLLLRCGTYPMPTTSGNAYDRSVLERVLPIPEQQFRIGPDGYLNAVTPFYGSIRSIDEELGQSWHHGANQYGGRGLDLSVIQHRVSHELDRESYIAREASRHGFEVPRHPELLNPEHVFQRIVLCRLGQGKARGEHDRVPALLLAGVRAVRGDEFDSASRRALWLAAMVITALSPRRAAEATARWTLATRPRPAWLRNIAHTFDRVTRMIRPARPSRGGVPRLQAGAGAKADGVRVLVLLSGLPLGGAERNVVSLLPRLKAAGVEPTLCTLSRARDSVLAQEVEATGVPRIDLKSRRLLDPAGYRRLTDVLRSGSYDLLHTQDKYSHILGLAAARATGTPVVMTRHVLQESTPNLRERTKGWLDGFALRHADKVIAVSDAVSRALVEEITVPSERICTIHNGIDVSHMDIDIDAAGARRRLGWTTDGPVVTMVGAFRPQKGQEVLIAATPAIRTAFPSVSVKLVGAGIREQELRDLAGPLGDTVVFLGERADVATILRASDVVALPSFAEALPNVLLEAAACGCPVVATRVGGVPDVVVDGQTGYLIGPGDDVALADRVVALLQDTQTARRFGARAQARVVSQFDLERQAAATAEQYRAVLRNLRARVPQ